MLLGLMIALMLIGMPVAFALAISSTCHILLFSDGVAPLVIVQRIVSGSNSFVLLAVPFFILAGELMNRGGITIRLVRFAEAAVGGVRGGLAYVVVLVNMIMAGVSGAAIADAAAVGSVMIPGMTKNGYSKGFSAAVNAASATIGPVIPPSVGFLIYASLSNVSVGKLFIAGAVPGFLMGVYLIVVCYIVSRKENLPAGEKSSFKKLFTALKDAIWALMMPVIILGGILGGIVTPTEAGAIAVLYGLIVGLFFYKELRFTDIPEILAKTAQQTAVIMIIIACAQAFGWILTREGAPELLMQTFGAITERSWVFLLMINALVILLGCFMEGGSVMIILTPLLMPLLKKYGVDPVHFGVVFQLNIMIGLLTPPVGMLLYIIMGISEVSMSEMLKHLKPFYIALILLLIMITLIPAITLFLPNVLN